MIGKRQTAQIAILQKPRRSALVILVAPTLSVYAIHQKENASVRGEVNLDYNQGHKPTRKESQ